MEKLGEKPNSSSEIGENIKSPEEPQGILTNGEEGSNSKEMNGSSEEGKTSKEEGEGGDAVPEPQANIALFNLSEHVLQKQKELKCTGNSLEIVSEGKLHHFSLNDPFNESDSAKVTELLSFFHFHSLNWLLFPQIRPLIRSEDSFAPK